jgi:16S rRNA (cytosine967-C5)-methyltransferase
MTGAAPRGVAAPARVCAYAVLRRVFEQGAYADEALAAEARGLDRRDRALAMRLSYGAVQRRATLDHFAERLAERPLDRLDGSVVAALRLGLYELLYSSGAPDHAVVADAVELAKHAGRGHGLVNAVLRRAARTGAEELLGGLGEGTLEEAALMHSHPEWVARAWWQDLGAEQARALMAADNEPGELALRVNTLVPGAAALAELPVQTRVDPLLPEALVADGPIDLHDTRAWREGAVIAQSRASMLVARALSPQPQQRVLDLCAAPGGKSTHLAALMEGTGEVVAVEHDRRRAGELVRSAQRLGAGNIRVEVADAQHPRSAEAPFDRVLVDPPCTGLGTLQAHPDLRWRVAADDPARLAAIQARILAAGAEVLRPGGLLVYSTCTISPTENERLIASFLDSHPNFAVEDLAGELAQFGAAAGDAPGSRCVLTLPHRDRTAGFFIARLRRS